MPFCPPVEAMHTVTIMSLKAVGLQLAVDTVLTSRQIRQFSPNFSRTTGSEAVEKLEGKDLFSPPCIDIWRSIRPPCPTACSTPAWIYLRPAWNGRLLSSWQLEVGILKLFPFQHVAIVFFGNRKMWRCSQTRCRSYRLSNSTTGRIVVTKFQG